MTAARHGGVHEADVGPSGTYGADESFGRLDTDGSHLRPHRLRRQVVDDIPTDHEIGDGIRGREQRQHHRGVRHRFLWVVEGSGAQLGKGDRGFRAAVPHADGHADLKQAPGHGRSHRAGADHSYRQEP